MNNLILRALKEAKKSSHIIHRIGAVIVDKQGKVVSCGYNKLKHTHPVQKRYACLTGNSPSEYLHAEIHAITKCKYPEKAYKIYVARLTKSGSIGCARPCPICELALKEFGIRRVEYTL